jgi:hypothetical protein
LLQVFYLYGPMHQPDMHMYGILCLQRSRGHPQCVRFQWSECISSDRTSNWRKPHHNISIVAVSFIIYIYNK